MGARVKKTARERLDEMRSVEGATNVPHSVSDNSETNAPAYQRASHKRKRAVASQQKEGTDRKRVTAKDRKDHLARNSPWQQHQTQASIQHAPLYNRPAVPMSVLQTAASEVVHRHQAAWPLRVQAPALVNGAAHMSLLNNYRVAAGAGIPTCLTNGSNGVVPVGSDSEHSTTVVKALTALGIPIPANSREAALLESPTRTCIPGTLLTPPNSGVALDQLRRSIALRETSEAALAPNSELRIGNVTRSKFSPNDKAVVTSKPAISGHSARPVPNPYHSPAVVQRVAKI